MNNYNQLQDRASRSRSLHEGESSTALCDRLSRTRDSSPRQLPTDHDHAVSTREYQTDQSSPISPLAAAGPALEKQKPPHRRADIDRVTPYQSGSRIRVPFGESEKVAFTSTPRTKTCPWGPRRGKCHSTEGVSGYSNSGAAVVLLRRADFPRTADLHGSAVHRALEFPDHLQISFARARLKASVAVPARVGTTAPWP